MFSFQNYMYRLSEDPILLICYSELGSEITIRSYPEKVMQGKMTKIWATRSMRWFPYKIAGCLRIGFANGGGGLGEVGSSFLHSELGSDTTIIIDRIRNTWCKPRFKNMDNTINDMFFFRMTGWGSHFVYGISDNLWMWLSEERVIDCHLMHHRGLVECQDSKSWHLATITY